MNTVCPACGVAVVPGYVRCPKCHAALAPGPARAQRPAGDPGGTAVARKGFPISAVIVALGVAAAMILVFGVRSGAKPTAAAPAPPPAPVEAVAPDPQPRVIAPVAVAPLAPVIRAQDPAVAAADLERTLRGQRLWGRVVITGPRIDVRSGSCADPAMRSTIEGTSRLLRGAGLTKLRCLEQSGAIVFERDL
jgi:hypothetical protein